MTNKIRAIFWVVTLCMVVTLFACNDDTKRTTSKKTEIVSMKITQPANTNKATVPEKPEAGKSSEQLQPTDKALNGDKKTNISGQDNTQEVVSISDHYDAKGKIDPFKSLIQTAPVDAKAPVKAEGPPRILTPLEKLALSQVRLVAVIEMKGRRIAMVEEASGKGYEVGVGTYIGKNGGKISQITKNSIVVKELVRDFRGKISEREQEIKLNKSDIEE